MPTTVSHRPARELIHGDVIMFDDGSEGEVTMARFGDPEEHGMVTHGGRIALPWMVSLVSVAKPVVTHPGQTFKVRRVTASEVQSSNICIAAIKPAQ